MESIRNRYNVALRNDYINNVISSQADQADTNLQTNMEESITKSLEARQDYLDSLAMPATTTTE